MCINGNKRLLKEIAKEVKKASDCEKEAGAIVVKQ